ncbi:MAG: transposase [Burkholderia sp.]|nr:MAG: hypothetical protein E5299_00552 [Burkholderia gladioli]
MTVARKRQRISLDLCSNAQQCLKVHHAKPVTAWFSEHVDEIEVFYLPSYSPELNPDEMLNSAPEGEPDGTGSGTVQWISQKSGHQLSTSSPEITTTCRSLFHA